MNYSILPIIIILVWLAITITLGIILYKKGFYMQINDKYIYSLAIADYMHIFNMIGLIRLISNYEGAEVHFFTRPVKEYSSPLPAGLVDKNDCLKLQVIITLPLRSKKEYRAFLKAVNIDYTGVKLEPVQPLYGPDTRLEKTDYYYRIVPVSLAVAFTKQCEEENITYYITEE